MEEKIDNTLLLIEKSEEDIKNFFMEKLIPGTSLGYRHYYLIAIAKRMVAQSSAFRSLIKSKNLLVATCLMRLQLDTVLYLYALTLVDNQEVFSKKVFNEKPIKDIKDKEGKCMCDGYVVNKINENYLFNGMKIKDIYKYSCGFIHFSNRHMDISQLIENIQ